MTDQPQEKDLLVPFEIQNIPGKYREYYAIKRQNFFASIQDFRELWKYYQMLDAIWLREFEDLEVARDTNRVFPLMVYVNAHAKVRIAIELALGGCIAEGRSILRDAVECVAHAHHMLKDPALQTIWLDKYDQEEAFKQAFERSKKQGLFDGVKELHEKWGELSELGSHATPLALAERFVITETAEGHRWQINYTGADTRILGMALFSMLLTSFVMENTFFDDYKTRLQLDIELVKMRQEFETYKEQLRQLLIRRYEVAPPKQR
ncbi:MAG: hypothetical protein ACLPND_21435, partial [Candidatus Korobacteraceae bacterium]